MGRRPKLEPDTRTLATLKNLGQWGATRDEAAAWLEVSRPTLWKFLAEYPEAEEAFTSGYDSGKATLRRWQWQAAKKGNTTMLIWLGKQMLKQRDDGGMSDTANKESLEAQRSEIQRKLDSVIDAQPKGELAKEPESV